MQKSSYSSARRNRKACRSSGSDRSLSTGHSNSQRHRLHRSCRQRLRESSQSSSSSSTSRDGSSSSSASSTSPASNSSTAAPASQRSNKALLPIWVIMEDQTGRGRSTRRRRKRHQRGNNNHNCSSSIRPLAKYAGPTEWQRRQQLENRTNSSGSHQVERLQPSRLNSRLDRRRQNNIAEDEAQNDDSELQRLSLDNQSASPVNAGQPISMPNEQFAVNQRQQQQQQQQKPFNDILVPSQNYFNANVNFNENLNKPSQLYQQQPQMRCFNGAQNGLNGWQFPLIQHQSMVQGQQQWPYQQQPQNLSYRRRNSQALPQQQSNVQQNIRQQMAQYYQNQSSYQAQLQQQQQQDSNNSLLKQQRKQQQQQQQHNSEHFQQPSPLLQQQQQRECFQFPGSYQPMTSWNDCFPTGSENWFRCQRQRPPQMPVPSPLHHPWHHESSLTGPDPLACDPDEDISKSDILAPPPPDFSSSVACPAGLSSYFNSVSLAGGPTAGAGCGIGLEANGGGNWQLGFCGASDPFNMNDSPPYLPYCDRANGFDRF